jgi:nitrite reductase/ring-hydroxylating ferredoxin subunit
MRKKKNNKENVRESCECMEIDAGRREFLAGTSCALIAALVSSGLTAAFRAPIAMASPVSSQGTERSYPIPASDMVNIDQDNDVIIVRQTNHVYAFALSCPHENTAQRWRPNDLRFQSPRHESKYQPDGTFVSGRSTRNMDRFAVRKDTAKVAVDLAKLFRSDQQKQQWDAAFITV